MTQSTKITTAATTANTTSFSVPIDTASSANRLLLVLGSIDGGTSSGDVSTASTGWQKLYYAYSADIGIFAFAKLGTGTSSDNLTINWTPSEQIAVIAYYIDGPPSSLSLIKFATSMPSTKSTSIDPPLLNAGTSQAYMWIEFGATDYGSSDATAPSTGFSLLTRSVTTSTVSTAGQSSFSAERQYIGASLDPDAFAFTRSGASTSDSTGAATIAIPVSGVSGPEPGRLLIAA